MGPRYPAGPMANQTANVAKTFVLALAGTICIFFGVGAILADHWVVETSRVVAAPPAKVVALLHDFDAWEKWSSMRVTVGPQLTRTVAGTPGQVGHRVTWSGAVGEFVMEFVRVEDGFVGYQFRGRPADQKDFEKLVDGEIRYRAEGTGTLVTWHEGGTHANYILRWLGWFGSQQDMVRRLQTTSLEGLQRAVEPDAAPATTPATTPAAPQQPK